MIIHNQRYSLQMNNLVYYSTAHNYIELISGSRAVALQFR